MSLLSGHWVNTDRCVFWGIENKTAGVLYLGPRDSTSAPGGKPPMSSGIIVPNSLVLPILEMERQSCSNTGSYALKVKFNLTAPAQNCQSAFLCLSLNRLLFCGLIRCGLRIFCITAVYNISSAYAAFIDWFMSLIILFAS